MDDCLACDLAAGRAPLPGGLIHETAGWRVEHCVGPLGVGTLVVKPKRHVHYLADLDPRESQELGPLLTQTASVVARLTDAAQVYCCLWSHGPVHLHFVVQPELDDVVAEHGVYGPRMQAAMFARGEAIDVGAATAFAHQAREAFG